jgi:hypothetical protein
VRRAQSNMPILPWSQHAYRSSRCDATGLRHEAFAPKVAARALHACVSIVAQSTHRLREKVFPPAHYGNQQLNRMVMQVVCSKAFCAADSGRCAVHCVPPPAMAPPRITPSCKFQLVRRPCCRGVSCGAADTDARFSRRAILALGTCSRLAVLLCSTYFHTMV